MTQLQALDKLTILNKIIKGSNSMVLQYNEGIHINADKAIRILFSDIVKLAELQKQIIDELVKGQDFNSPFADLLKGEGGIL